MSYDHHGILSLPLAATTTTTPNGHCAQPLPSSCTQARTLMGMDKVPTVQAMVDLLSRPALALRDPSQVVSGATLARDVEKGVHARRVVHHRSSHLTRLRLLGHGRHRRSILPSGLESCQVSIGEEYSNVCTQWSADAPECMDTVWTRLLQGPAPTPFYVLDSVGSIQRLSIYANQAIVGARLSCNCSCRMHDARSVADVPLRPRMDLKTLYVFFRFPTHLFSREC